MPNFQLALSGVEPGTYGGQTKIPCIKVDKSGRITFAESIDLTTMLSSVEGELNINVTGNVTGNVVGSIRGEIYTNSISTDGEGSVIVNSELRVLSDVVTEGRFNGTLIGDVFGDLTGNTFGVHTGAVSTDTVHITHIEGRSLPPQIKIETEEDNQRSHALFIKGAFPSREAQSITSIRSRGTLLNPAPLEKNDMLFSFEFLGTGPDNRPGFSSGILFEVDRDISSGIVPGRINFVTVSSQGIPRSGLTIDSDQLIRIADNIVSADKVNTSSISYLKIWIGDPDTGSAFAIPVHPLNP